MLYNTINTIKYILKKKREGDDNDKHIDSDRTDGSGAAGLGSGDECAVVSSVHVG